MQARQIINKIKKGMLKQSMLKQSTLIIIFIIVLIIFLGSCLYYKNKTVLTENFFNDDDDEERSKLDSFYDYIGGKGDEDGYSFGGLSDGLDSAVNALSVKKRIDKPKWNDLEYDDGELSTKLSLYTSRDISNLELEIITDNCSQRSLLKSDYKDDICETYVGDYTTINEKCRGLNERTCPLTNCCVLLNGNKCVGGNNKGPTFYTNNGNDITFQYYEHRGKRYPEYDPTTESTNKCGKYANNSTGVSKDCMIQLFNEAGCLNKKPDTIITDEYVEKHIKSTKRYIRNDLMKKASLLKSSSDDLMVQRDKIITCNGILTECDNYLSSDKNVSGDCMVEQFKKERLAQLKAYYKVPDTGKIMDASLNQVLSFITDDNIDLMQKKTKREVFTWIKENVVEAIQPLIACDKFKDTDRNVSEACIKGFLKDDIKRRPEYYGMPENDPIFNARWQKILKDWNLVSNLTIFFKSWTKKRVLNILPSLFRYYIELVKEDSKMCNSKAKDPKTGQPINNSIGCIKFLYSYLIFAKLWEFGGRPENIKTNRVFLEKNITPFINTAYVNSVWNRWLWDIFGDMDARITKRMADYLQKNIKSIV